MRVLTGPQLNPHASSIQGLKKDGVGKRPEELKVTVLYLLPTRWNNENDYSYSNSGSSTNLKLWIASAN